LTGGTITLTVQNINAGGQPFKLVCSAATGGGCTASTYQYQWQQTLDYVTYTDIPGATQQDYTPPPLYVTTHFVRVVNCNGQRANSNASTVNVHNPFNGGTISADASTITYNTPANFSNVASASGGLCTGTIFYIWWGSTDGVNYTQLIPFDGISGTSPPLTNTIQIYRQARCTNNFESANSNIITITVMPPLQSGIIPGPANITAGTDGGTIQATPSGGNCNGAYSYQWESGPDGINFNAVLGDGTHQYYHPGILNNTTYFRCHVYCGTEQIYTPVAKITVSPAPNYVRVRTISKPGITDPAVTQSLTDPRDVQQTTTYFDGLGKSIQTVSKKASPLGNDLVLPQVYDAFGRESMHYLPYVGPSSDGEFRINALTEQATFNGNQFPNEQYYYGRTDFEPSPLNRPITTYVAGNSWVGSGRGVATNYLINDVTDSVRIWTIAAAPGSLPVSSTAYGAGLLYKSNTTDEQGHQAVEYKDMEGHVVLKKVQSWDSPAAGHSGWLCTYYIYDDLDNLRFVLSPKAVELISNTGWALNQGIADELCFRYEYDQRNRMVIKKVPGAGELWMVYDARDRLVMTQDSSARHDGYWIVTKYDDLNRPDSTGKLLDGNTRNYHQNLANNTPGYPLITGSGYTSLIRTFFDDYSWLPATTPLLNSIFSTKYTGNANYFITNLNTSPQYAQAMTASQGTRGMVTGMATDVIGSSYNLFRVNFYDDHSRLLQTISTNFQSGRDTTTLQYDFSGKTIRKLVTHSNQSSQVKLYTASTKINYDAAGRQTSTWMRLDNATSDQLIDSIQYNELGQLRAKYLGNYLDSMVYDYNIRGWINSINRNYIAGTVNNYFGLELGYDQATSAAPGNSFQGFQYNGNIAGEVWKSAGDGINRKYDFTYDNVNRLKDAAFTQNTPGTGWNSDRINFSTHNLSYDANGNILSMSQTGFKITGSSPIDQLNYGYISNSNKLNQVTDAANNPSSTLGDFHYTGNKTGQDYTYDGNGNLHSDMNKGISFIYYDHLNLPESISFPGKGLIQYTYTADGNKIRKIVYDSVTKHQIWTVYTEDFVYNRNDSFVSNPNVHDTLQFVQHDEGRTRWALHHFTNGTSTYGWEYDFFEKDHLGNTRIVLTQQKDTAQYLATMEAAYRTTEDALFYDVSKTASPTPPNFPAEPNMPGPNNYVSLLDGYTYKTGPAILLKVMSGDSVKLGCNSYYGGNGSIAAPHSSYDDILYSLSRGLVSMNGAAAHGVGSLADLNASSSPLAAAVNTFLSAKNPNTTSTPKAYLNWMLLDNQFSYVSANSGAIPVGSPEVLNTLASTVAIKNSGYLYVWVSNETQFWQVMYDNLFVQHISGPMTEENHYYPFGLTMAGISDKALKGGYAENKYRNNGGNEIQNKEFTDGTGLEAYDATFRMYDPQLGRFWQQDPLADANESWSLYSFVNDNPVSFSDPLGLADSTAPSTLSTPKKPQELAEVTVTAKKKDCKTCEGPSVAGAYSLLTTYNPLRVVPKGPTPVIEFGIIGEASPGVGLSVLRVAGRTLGTLALVLWPISAPGEGLHWKPYTGHGNDKDNDNPHIVYEFSFTPPKGDPRTPILKYGISDEFRFGMGRPERQLPYLRARFGASVVYRIYTRTSNRELALLIENLLVREHIMLWKEKPRVQDRP